MWSIAARSIGMLSWISDRIAISIALSCLLIDANVVHLEPGRKLGLRRITAIRPTDGEVQDQVMRLAERVFCLFVAVECLMEVDRVQQQTIHSKPDGALVPV